MKIPMSTGTVQITCGGKPLEGTYLPPASDLALLGRYLARRYAATDEPSGSDINANKEDTN